VGVHVDFNGFYKQYGMAITFNVTYDIYFSKDNGSNWEKKLRVTQTNTGQEQGTAQEVFEHTFVDSAVNAVRLDYVSWGPQLIWELLGVYSFTNLDEIRMNYVSYWFDPGATIVNNRMLFYDSMENKWSRYKGWNASCFCALKYGNDNGAEYFGDSFAGRIFLMNEGVEDDGNSIFGHIMTGYTDAKFPEVKKRWLRDSIVMDLGNDDVHFSAYIDRLEMARKTLSRKAEGDREQYYDEIEYGEGYYSLHEGEKHFSVNLDPNSGYRMAEELWVNNREGLVVRGRIGRFVKRE
jgi:hypothetical protein